MFILQFVGIYLFVSNIIFIPIKGTDVNENPFTAVVRKMLIGTAKSCMEHVGATEADLEDLKKDPPYPDKAACILKCLLEKIGVVKNNRYSKTGFLAVVTPLVLRNKKKLDHMKNVSENCDKEIKHLEAANCQLGSEIVACVFKYAPELHLKG